MTTVVLKSSGGERAPDYVNALRLLLDRIAELDLVVADALVDTLPVRRAGSHVTRRAFTSLVRTHTP